MGAIKQKLIEISEIVEQLLSMGVTESELDEYMNNELNKDEYKLYYTNKDTIFEMIGQDPHMDDEEYDLESKEDEEELLTKPFLAFI